MKNNKKLNIKSIYSGTSFRYDRELKIWKALPDIILFVIFLFYILTALVFFSTYSYYTVQHSSMRPLLNNYDNEQITDGVYVNLFADYEVGDVIVVSYEDVGQTTTVVKRLVAVGGDKIAIRELDLDDGGIAYQLLRIPEGNSVPYVVIENYLSIENRLTGMKKTHDYLEEYMDSALNENEVETIDGVDFLVLEEGEIFYLGDNRANSLDCSSYGPKQVEEVVGKVEIVVKEEKNMFFHIMEYMLGFKTV